MSDIATKVIENIVCRVRDHDGPNPWTELTFCEETLKASINQALQSETRSLLEDRLKLEAEVARLREALKPVLGGQDCPMCQHGRLINPLKEHWDECSFSKAQETLSQPTNTTGLLDLAVAGYFHAKAGFMVPKNIAKAYEALPQDIKDAIESM